VSSDRQFSAQSYHALQEFSSAPHLNLSQCNRTHHFQRPDTPDPYFQFSFDTFDILQLDALPPTSSGWLSPEQQQLLSHTNGVRGSCGVALDVGP
jgi:hypothetical protein